MHQGINMQTDFLNIVSQYIKQNTIILLVNKLLKWQIDDNDQSLCTGTCVYVFLPLKSSLLNFSNTSKTNTAKNIIPLIHILVIFSCLYTAESCRHKLGAERNLVICNRALFTVMHHTPVNFISTSRNANQGMQWAKNTEAEPLSFHANHQCHCTLFIH